MMQLDYTTINERAFDFLADRYARRKNELNNLDPLVEMFFQYILANFSNPSVLEMGVGSGDMLKYFSECFKTTAIDISSKMIEVAKRKAPSTAYLHSDFLKYDFSDKKFSGVFSGSVLHLFPREQIDKVLDKIYSILEEQGAFYLSVPLFNEFKEEIIKRGDNFVLEYRIRYTEEKFNKVLTSSRLNLMEKSVTKFMDSQRNTLSKLNMLLVK